MAPTTFDYPLSRPDVGDAERSAVLEVLSSDRLALGPWLERFEADAARRLGVRYAVATSSGTAALHVLVRSLGIGPGDEVVTSPFSFVASANAILFEGARAVFADIDETSLDLDPARVEEAVGPRTKALLPVHIFGQPAAMPELMAIAERRGLAVIEDACEAIGARIGDRQVGTWGNGATLAFYPNKQVTTGEGGMVLTDDEDVARMVRSLCNQGRGPGAGWFDHVRLGYNYRMSELGAALGVVQLSRLPEILAARERVAASYARHLAGVSGARPLPDVPGTTRSWFVHPVLLDPSLDRDRVGAALAARGVQNARYFPPIHLLPHFRDAYGHRPGDFPVTERVARRTLALPFFNSLSDAGVADVVGRLSEAIREVGAP